MDTSVKASCNWTLIGGNDISKAIQTKVTHEDVFIKPKLDEILSEDRAILLGQPTPSSPTACEFQIRVFPRYKIESLTLVCSTAKLELFFGAQKEYTETLYGSAIIEDEDDNVDESQDTEISSYRYDVEINKSGVIEVVLKLLTHSTEICIYGIVLNIAPNPNGITTLLPNAINLDNVQQMLNNSNSKLSPSAEKCKMFMQMFKSANNPNIPQHNSNDGLGSILQQMKLMVPTSNTSKGLTTQLAASDLPMETPIGDETSSSHNFVNDLRVYIDGRFEAFETKLLSRLDIFEASQSAKLDKILKLLENKG